MNLTTQKFYFIQTVAFCLFACLSVFAHADIDARADVTIDNGGLTVSAPLNIPNYTGMTLNVGSPGGGVETSSSSGTQLYWSAASVENGTYRYTVHVALAFEDDNPSSEAIQTRTSGSFYVVDGQIEVEPVASLMDNFVAGTVYLVENSARVVGQFFVPGAQAQDLTTSSFIPRITFEDTSVGSGVIWEFETDDPGAGTGPVGFELEYRANGFTEIIDIMTDEDGDQSIVIDEAGDITLANGAFYIDRSNGEIGMGTTTPAANVHVVGSGNTLLRLESTGSQAWDTWVGGGSGGYRLTDVAGSNSALFVSPEGSPSAIYNYFGYGTSTPTARLHVQGNSAIEEDVQIRVENFNTASPGIARKLFQIINDGPAKFSMISSASDEWAFNARDTEFRISKQGTGDVEMELSETGNLSITGTLTQGSSRAIKHDIVAVNSLAVLDKVTALPIATWSYNRDANGIMHLGPMAEDFYQAFGLGHTNKGLTSIDTSGVALAAIKGLRQEKDAEIEQLKAANKAALLRQDERILQLEMALAEVLRKQVAGVQLSAVN